MLRTVYLKSKWGNARQALRKTSKKSNFTLVDDNQENSQDIDNDETKIYYKESHVKVLNENFYHKDNWNIEGNNTNEKNNKIVDSECFEVAD